MNNKLLTLALFVAIALSPPGLAGPSNVPYEYTQKLSQCQEYLDSIKNSAAQSHEKNQFLIAMSAPYYLIPGAWFLAFRNMLGLPNPVQVITQGKEFVAVHAINTQGSSFFERCDAIRSTRELTEKALGTFGSSFILYHYFPDLGSPLTISYIALHPELLAE